MQDMPDMPAPVRAAFAALGHQAAFDQARSHIFAEAERCDVGPLTETLKWGQPAYLTLDTKAGTTLRLGLHGGDPALFVHCQTTVIEQARAVFGDAPGLFRNRGVLLDRGGDVVSHIVAAALTYHRRSA